MAKFQTIRTKKYPISKWWPLTTFGFIKQYLKEKDKNHDLNITLPRELTAISLEIDTKTGEYYFNIPAEGNFGTNYPAPKIDAIHLGIDGKVTTFDETKNSDSILVSIYTKGTLAYTLTHNTYNDQFADLPGHIIPGTYQNKKDLLLIEAIKTTKNEKIQDNIQNYKILTVEPDKITIEVTSKPKKNSPEWTLIIGRHNWAIGSGWKDKATTEVTSAKEIGKTTEENDSKEVYPTSQKDIENIINLNNNII